MKKVIVHGFFLLLVLFVALRTYLLIRTTAKDFDFEWYPLLGNNVIRWEILEFSILFLAIAFLYKIAKDFIKE